MQAFNAYVGDYAVSTSGFKTALQIRAAANKPVKVRQVNVSFDGTSSTAQPVKVEVIRSTADGTASPITSQGNPGTSLSSTSGLNKLDAGAEVPQTTALHTFTAEPGTLKAKVWGTFLHPQGAVTYSFPLDCVVAAGDAICVRMLAAAAVNAHVNIIGEE